MNEAKEPSLAPFVCLEQGKVTKIRNLLKRRPNYPSLYAIRSVPKLMFPKDSKTTSPRLRRVLGMFKMRSEEGYLSTNCLD